MKSIVFGAFGQLGSDLAPRLPGEVVALRRADVELTDAAAVSAMLELHRPTHVINCAAYNLVDKAESDPEVAFANNALAVRGLALACRNLDLPLIHFSTDYVFGANESGMALTENIAPVPVSAYGVSKLSGEYFVRTLCPKHMVFRVCGLYGVKGSGGKGGNFVETMLKVAGMGKPLRVVADQFCTPSYTVDVAEAVVAMLPTKAWGLYHLTNAGHTSWFDFAAEIFRQTGVEANLTAITAKEFGAAAARPAWSVLDNAKIHGVGIVPRRDWASALAAYLDERSRK